jgi:hypothetical protein
MVVLKTWTPATMTSVPLPCFLLLPLELPQLLSSTTSTESTPAHLLVERKRKTLQLTTPSIIVATIALLLKRWISITSIIVIMLIIAMFRKGEFILVFAINRVVLTMD